ncbi:MAG: helix-turn-helix domain-containing protein [Oscillospiraceae bacterium]|nr:helix-turn-helix domain-containing protein [Oscillospiraceae bacterium]
MKFNERLYELREDSLMSKTDLAEVLGTTRQMITRYEAGISIPAIDILLAAANHFGVSADYLLGRDDYLTLHRDKNRRHMVFPGELTDTDIEFVKDVVGVMRKRRQRA